MEDVNFNQKIINLLDTKNKEKREVRMNDIVYTALINHKATQQDSLYLFPNKEGSPYQDIKKSFHNALKKAGIQKFRFHDLRHTWASQMAMAGVPLETIQKLSGWKCYNMVLRYTHLSPDYQKRWVDHFEKQMVTIWSQRDASEVSGKKTEASKPNDLNEK